MPKTRRPDAVVVFVTCGKRREAKRIAEAVVERKLAACVNMFAAPVDSIYRWKGKVEAAREFLLLIKTTRPRLATLQAQIEERHSYQVIEFLALPIAAGSPAYLDWLADSVRKR
jgi:periplasmic divalent cation tolerance protein